MTDRAEYYETATAWAQDRQRDLLRSRQVAWIAAGGIAVIAGLEALALAMLLPLKHTETVAMLVDRTTGYTQVIDPAAPRRVRADRALLNSLLAQYVAAREGYDRATTNDTYRKVALWSFGPARASYLRATDSRNTDVVAARPGPGQIVDIRIKSVSLLSPRNALVRFEATTRGRDGIGTGSRSWISVIGFRFAEGAMAVEDQYLNPLGFQVTSYRRDAEAPELPAQGDVM
jgi:type IV secretion system protein VirB8